MRKLLSLVVILITLVACKKEDPDPPITDWCLVMEDEFDTLDLNYWTPTVAPNGNTYRTDRPENVRTDSGYLIMELHKENYEGYAYTGADIVSPNIGPYGRVECRARLPKANIAWPVFWLLGDYEAYGEWPNCGEIDIMEYWGHNAPSVFTNLHTKHSNFKNGNDRDRHSFSHEIADASDEFHVYGMHWYNNRLEFYLDGVNYWTFNQFSTGWKKWPYDHPMKIVFQMYATEDYDGSDADLPDIFEVDWVRVYEGCP